MTAANQVEILLVEDNENDVELTLRALSKHNLANRVHVVRDGAEAVDAVKNLSPAPKVVLLDLKLPKLNGLEVLKRIKSDERTKTLPVVMLTSSREEPDIAEAYRLGANSYIVKPVDFEDFVRAVSDAGLYWLLLNQPPQG
ncbi:MAG TPA: response regulator [Gemmatimonadales bacterium]